MARNGAQAKRYADEDAAIAKVREAARAAAAARVTQTNGTHEIQHKPKLPQVSCVPTLPESAVVTPSAKGPRLEGQRNLQDSTFSISG